MKNTVLKSRPPYKIEKKLLKIDEEVAKSQFKIFAPLYTDLDWYVLKESYEGFFEKNERCCRSFKYSK